MNVAVYGRPKTGTLSWTPFTATTRTYDNAGRLLTLENKKGAATISSFTYTLDAVGQRTQVVDTTGTTTYAYDNIYRLTGVTYPGAVTDTYTYDDVGNRLTKTPSGAATINYTYDAADQMLTAAAVSYGYDNDGNQTSRGSDTFTWDHENRMTGATVGGKATTYGYNGDGLRAKKTQGWTTTNYTYSVRRSLPVLLDDGTNQYVYGLGLIGMVGPWWSVSYFLPDGLGSTANVTDASGNVTATYTYGVFGAIRTSSGSSTNPFLFTGEQKDNETGYTYLRARYYDPAIGRLISRDFRGGRYVYVRNNPVNSVDPTGLWPWDDIKNWIDGAGSAPGVVIDAMQSAIDHASGAAASAVVDAAEEIVDLAWTAELTAIEGIVAGLDFVADHTTEIAEALEWATYAAYFGSYYALDAMHELPDPVEAVLWPVEAVLTGVEINFLAISAFFDYIPDGEALNSNDLGIPGSLLPDFVQEILGHDSEGGCMDPCFWLPGIAEDENGDVTIDLNLPLGF